MATSSDLLHTNESNNCSDESISNCANSSNLAESQADEESIQTNNADSEAATSPGVHENEDVDSKADFGATPCHEKTEQAEAEVAVDEQPQQQAQQQQQLEPVEQTTTLVSSSATETQRPEAHSNFSPDEIPEPIKVLDDIISEFEDTSKPANAGGNGENQSEDDGYMSLSRKNMHKQDFENVSQSSIGSNVPPITTPTKEFHEFNNTTDVTCQSLETPAEQNIIQSTLPKARPASALTSNNYSSLPCCGARSTSLDGKTTRGVSCNGERNKLGIDISAVHNAVLRGGLAKLPEPILNEHPVTIYPGRYSPPSENKRVSNRPQRILSSVEKHKEVCHILNPLSSISSSSSSSSSNCIGLMDNKALDIPNNILKKPYIRKDNIANEFRLVSEDDFSDDSIEEQSLSPITSHSSPHKQTGIAWEIHFKSNKKKSKSSAKKKSTRKHTLDCVATTENGVYPLPIVASDVFYTKENERAYRREPIVIDALDGSDQYTTSSGDILNHCMYRHGNTSMLGKGTFIIRRPTNKPPTAMDIFQKDAEALDRVDTRDQSDYEEFSSMEGHENCRPSETLNANVRHSGELLAPQGPTLPSPRDRLSLNLEPQLPNIFTKEMLAVHKGDRSSSEELLVPVKKTSLNREPKRRSTDSINTKSSSYEETEENEPNEVATFISGKNSFDACNMYGYKNDAAGCLKGQEFSDLRSSTTTTPRTDLAPTLEEEEEQYSDFSYSGAPGKDTDKVDGNINALLRGDIAAVRIVEGGAHHKRPLEFRPGVHKSESAKEMLLSQSAFGPLPPSPPSSNPDLFDYDALPLPPSPKDPILVNESNRSLGKGFKKTTTAEIHTPSSLGGEERRNRDNMSALRYLSNELPPLPPPAFENMPPVVPPHRGHSANTMKSWSIDSHYKKRSPKMLGYGSGITTPTGSQYDGSYSTKRYVSYGTKRSLKQSPREELRLQTSCSLPETPIFARGSCDIPRTPFRRQPESAISGSRTAPRSSTSHSINMGNTMGGIPGGGNTFGAGMCRQRSMNHALASNEMLRMAGAPARGWYPKQRSMRPASTENIDRLSSSRVWDSAAGMSGTGQSRKPLTLPPNLTPSFLNKSPREALRRVTSLLIAKKKNTKERKGKPYSDTTLDGNLPFEQETALPPTPKEQARNFNNTSQKPQKKKGLFKSLWKKTKHFSLDQ
ncbi:uncharacterized protein LOC120767834 isoform X2 [Bactrocera tryoni]|uniref:uncharacterized protein LOC120767834 isoform X2 n=1 Tax=Bactrocera tryoni TaxID=59916 RepID=UPI001A9698F1|nr:uncharacterized protein LOC120767834 isoform X2 [Bactrocera tryoni]